MSIFAKNPRKTFILTGIIVIAGIAAALYIYRTSIYWSLYDLKLIPRDENFTELYFENHTELPKTIVKGQTIAFSFTLHNLEGRNMEYPYIVYFDNGIGYGPLVIDKGTATVPEGEYKTIAESYTFKSDQPRQEVFVELVGRDQSLHFVIGSRP